MSFNANNMHSRQTFWGTVDDLAHYTLPHVLTNPCQPTVLCTEQVAKHRLMMVGPHQPPTKPRTQPDSNAAMSSQIAAYNGIVISRRDSSIGQRCRAAQS